MSLVYLSIGGNLGDVAKAFEAAIQQLRDNPATQALRLSPLYRTAAQGVVEQPDFLNAVIELKTELSPEHLLELCQSIETNLGRRREQRWGPRTLDIDILLYDELTVESPQLSLPHPRLAERAFVLKPLADLRPELCLFGKDLESLLESVSDQRLSRLE